MTECRDIIQRLRMGMGPRAIQRDTGVHRTIIRGLRELAERQGWLRPESVLPREEEIQKVREEARESPDSQHPLHAYLEEFRLWVKEGYTYVVMHQLIKDRCPCSEPTVRRFVQKYLGSQPKVVMVRATVPGRDMEVDFGYLGITYDEETRRNRKTYLFSGRLRHSRLAYREAGFHQKASAFFTGHIHAFEYFGGVPAKGIPDNTKAAVVVASHEDPVINRAYHELAEHYGFLINPCPPYQPQKKGGVENDIKYVKNNFWPLFKEQQKSWGREVPSFADLQRELVRWTQEVAETRMIGGVGRSPREIFESEERSALNALPPSRWDPLSWARPLVGADFLVQFERAFYSVPYGHIGQRVIVLGSRHTVRVFRDYQEIARHHRAARPWQIMRNPLHAPPQLEQYMNATSEGLLQWSFRIGEPVGKVAQSILSDKAVDGMRPVRALLHLAGRYSPQRLIRACERALLYQTPTYRSVKEILVKNLDEGGADPVHDQKSFRFQRRGTDFDPAYFMHSRN